VVHGPRLVGKALAHVFRVGHHLAHGREEAGLQLRIGRCMAECHPGTCLRARFVGV
jgi:hypothetical protein